MAVGNFAGVVVPIAVAAVWYVVAPIAVSLPDKRLRSRNPSRYAKLVKVSRAAGAAAAALGFLLARVL